MKKSLIIYFLVLIVFLLSIYIYYRCFMPDRFMESIGFTGKQIINCVDDNYYCIDYYPESFSYMDGSRYILVKKKIWKFSYNYDFLDIPNYQLPAFYEDANTCDKLMLGSKKENDKYVQRGSAERITWTKMKSIYKLRRGEWVHGWYYKRPDWFYKLFIPNYEG